MATKAREARSRLGVARAAAVLAIVCATALLAGAERASSSAIGPCGSNPVVCENQLPGTPQSQWDIQGSGDPTIQGYATPFSVADGQTVRFKVDTDASNYRLDIYRLGWYGGLGARLVTTVQPSAPLPQNQPDCIFQAPVRPGRLRELGGIGFVGRPAGRRLRGLPRAARAHRHRRGQPRRLRRSRRPGRTPTCSSRPPTRPGRRTTATAATASMSARPDARTRSATTVPSKREHITTSPGSSAANTR